jgi:hypothetical protein
METYKYRRQLMEGIQSAVNMFQSTGTDYTPIGTAIALNDDGSMVAVRSQEMHWEQSKCTRPVDPLSAGFELRRRRKSVTTIEVRLLFYNNKIGTT